MKYKGMTLFIAMLLLFGFAVPVYAVQPDDRKLELTLHAGSPEMLVDGLPITIPAPYITGGTTMVPLSVFTRVLGAELKLKNNHMITLRLPDGEVQITLNSQAALADGKQVTLPAAPTVNNGLTFVPVRLLEWFGAAIYYDPDTREIVAKVAAAKQQGRHGSAIDADAGKTGIGDSQYQWSMSYPTGLILDYQSTTGDAVIFQDLKQEYYLGIFIESAPNDLDAEDRQDRLYEYIDWDEIIVDRMTFDSPNAIPYNRMTTKDRSGFYYELRGMQANGYFYVVVFGKKASSIHELRQHTIILDSFKPSFDKGNIAIKNLAKGEESLSPITNKDYGLTIDLPQTWTESPWVSTPYFSPASEDAYLWMNVTSLMPGDTLEDWVDRSLWRFEHVFAEDYRLEPNVRELTWNGTPAQVIELTYSLDTQQWWKEYEIFAIHGKYRYYTEFAFMNDAENDYEDLFTDILSGMKVDYEVVENHFGNIPDDGDIIDMTTTVERTNHTYGYSVTVPKFWKIAADDLESDYAEFSFIGGSFRVIVLDDDTYTPIKLEELRKGYLQRFEDEDEVIIIEDTLVNFGDTSARKLVMDDFRNEDRVPSRDISYLFIIDGVLYVVEGTYGIAHASDFIIDQLDTAIHSFTLTNS